MAIDSWRTDVSRLLAEHVRPILKFGPRRHPHTYIYVSLFWGARASHWPFDEWGRFLPEPTTATSMIDRFLSRIRDKKRYSDATVIPRSRPNECGADLGTRDNQGPDRNPISASEAL